MECKCGGATKEAKAERSKVGVVLEYRVCGSCGRNEYTALLVHGKHLAAGIEAQRIFVDLDGPAPDPTAGPAPTPVSTVATKQPEPTPVPAVKPEYPKEWSSPEERPLGNELIRVRFVTGGFYIERPSYFQDRWDLIDGWQPYDNRAGLAASFTPPPIPAELRASSLCVTSTQSTQQQQPRAARQETREMTAAATPPAPAPAPAIESVSVKNVPVGSTFSLF